MAGTQVRNPERYQILNEHGRGGLGRVSRAHDRELGRDIAIKELISRGSVSDVRFLREALITARLEHPGIVPVHEAGRWPDGTPFYAMKLVSGRPLRDLINERTTVDQRLGLLHHVIAVADAIAYAHGRDIIHRDLKPANVIVGDFGETVVIDWGLAKDLSTSDKPAVEAGPFRTHHNDDLTATGSVLGTPAYMAPEQERGEQVDQRADVFAIGAMLWELCSLQKVPPANERQRHKLLRREGIDRDLITIIDRTLDRDPTRRYRDASALAADLKSFKAGARIAARSYSLPAMLAHWTRRHRALAASAAAVLVVAAAGVAVYVRNVTSERNRADAALVVADTERKAATAERDRAQLSEAMLLLEKDPTRARDLLNTITKKTPQHSLLLSRATQNAAIRIRTFDGGTEAIWPSPNIEEIAITTNKHELYIANFDLSELRRMDKGTQGPIVYGDREWLYSRSDFNAPTMLVSSNPVHQQHLMGKLLAGPTSKLKYAKHQLFILEPSGDVFRIKDGSPTIIARKVRSIAADGELVMTCMMDGSLEIAQGETIVSRSRCAPSDAPHPIAVAGSHYAALYDLNTLMVNGRKLTLPARASEGHALVITPTGLVAFADYSGIGWFVRPDSNQIELAPRRGSSPLSVDAEGAFVAWGYQDGSVVVIDTNTSETWEFVGHHDSVYGLILNSAQRTIVSASNADVRVWKLPKLPIRMATRLPCTPFHLIPLEDRTLVSLDCSDGGVRLWNTVSNLVTELHHHTDMSFGLTYTADRICSGGWDGKVLCTSLKDFHTQTLLDGHGRIRWISSDVNRSSILASTADGSVWKIDDATHLLFKHQAEPYRFSTNQDGHWLSSVALDGSLIVYDLFESGVIDIKAAHRNWIPAVHSDGSGVWTVGFDGDLTHWTIASNNVNAVETFQIKTKIRFFRPFIDGIVTATEPDLLDIRGWDARSMLSLEIGKPLGDVQISENQRFVAAAGHHEIVIIDRVRHAIASINSVSSEFVCLQFLQPMILAMCDQSSIHVVDLSSMPFEYYSQ